jgi:type IX secretion system PorP/SprF family membrane protein
MELVKRIFVSFWLLLSAIFANAQDIQFSQFYAAQTYISPAFAGAAHDIRGILHSRLQWPSLDAKYNTMFVSGDVFLHQYNSGVGFYMLRDWVGSSTITSTELQGQYAYELHLNDRYAIRFGLQAGLIYRTLNYNNLRFPNQFDNTGFQGDSIPPSLTGRDSKIMPDISTGAMFYGKRIWGGLGIHHLNQPNQGFTTNDPLKMRVSLIGGYRIPLIAGHHMAYMHDSPVFEIIPTFHYKSQLKNDQLDLGMYGQYEQLMAGFWYRGIPVKNIDPQVINNESIVLMVGWQYKDLSISYSYDIVVSRLTQAGSGGAHELNITYLHQKHNKHHKPMKRLPCPSFYRH